MTMAKVIHYPDRAQWLEGRKMGIGASEVPTIIGVNPFQTPLQLWRRKKEIDPPVEENFAMRAGHYLEDAVAQFFAHETGAHIIQASADDFIIIDEHKPFLRVSPDRTYWKQGETHSERNKCILECKTTQMEIDEDDLPMHWFCQLQMNLGVSGYKRGALAWLTMGREFGYKFVDFDPQLFEWMVAQTTHFWEYNILQDVEPDMTEVADTLLKYPLHTAGKTIEADSTLVDTLRKLKEIKEEISALTSSKEKLEADIKMAMNDAEAIVKDGKTLCTWKAPKQRQKFNEKRFKAEEEDMWEEYCEPYQGSRTFLVK